jgi:hypothetical protein
VEVFDSRLLNIIHIVAVKLGPVIRKTHVRRYTILSIAKPGVALEIALAIEFAVAISSTGTSLLVQHVQIHRAVLLWYEEDMPEV